LHFWVGISIAALFGIPLWYKGRRRYFLHFMGNDPLTLGEKKLWVAWYVLALAFELVTSFLTHRLYVEVALSAFQAVAVTMGAFAVDRMLMMFETPGLYPHRTDAVAKPQQIPTDVAVQPNVVTEEKAKDEIKPPTPPASEIQTGPSEAWLTGRLRSLARLTAVAPGQVADAYSQAREERREKKNQDRAGRDELKEEALRREKEERDARLSDSLDKF